MSVICEAKDDGDNGFATNILQQWQKFKKERSTNLFRAVSNEDFFGERKIPLFSFFVHTVKSVFLTVSGFLLVFFLVFKLYIIDRSLTDV